MIEAIHSLGQYALQEKELNLKNTDHLTEILIEDPASSPSYKKILKISIKKNGDDLEYDGIIVDDYDSGKKGRLLYKKGDSGGTDFTPTSRITTAEKTFIRLLRWFTKNHSNNELKEDEKEILTNIMLILNKYRKKIISEIESLYGDIKKDKLKAILTIELLENNLEKFPGDLYYHRKLLVDNFIKKNYNKHNTTSKALEQTCSVCRLTVPEVYGFSSTYSFYTVDKKGMVAGGFDQSKAWKNYPVCKDCIFILEMGKQWLNKHANYNFYGFDYLLIPKPLNKGIGEEVYNELKYYQEEGKKVKLTGEYDALLEDTKEEVLKLLSEKPNTFQCNMLIYRTERNEFKILRYIEGIYPTDLKRLFDAKKKVDTDEYVKKTIPVWNKGKNQLTFNFGFFWYFLEPNIKKKEDKKKHSKHFLDVVNNVFKGKHVNRQFLISQIVQQIRITYVNGFNIEEPVMKGLCCLLYLDELELLDFKEKEKMSVKIRDIFPTEEKSRVETAETIFKNYPKFFKDDAKKAVFLVGVLSQLLMDIQRMKRKISYPKPVPFRSKLMSLRLDERKIKALLPEIMNKLEEYESNWYQDLEQLIAEYIVQAQCNWTLSNDEISFYFALGMSLSKYFKTDKKEEKKDE